MVVVGDAAYIGGINDEDMSVLDLSDPTNPKVFGAYAILVGGAYAFTIIPCMRARARCWRRFPTLVLSSSPPPTQTQPQVPSGVVVCTRGGSGRWDGGMVVLQKGHD